MEFIGRQTELSTLNIEYSRNESFVVIYGRRRVGKTTLIKEFLRHKTAFYFLATEELERQSMSRLADVIARTTQNPQLTHSSYTDWQDLFELIAQYQPNEKKVLVIDEFPYLVKNNPAFPAILRKAWDEVLKPHNIMLVLAGSFVGMMEKHALSDACPLHGCITAQMHLAPLSFTQVYNAQSLFFDSAVKQFAVIGGVPKYLDLFDSELPLMDLIKERILSTNGFLYEEPAFLLKNESVIAGIYFSILKVIADGNHKLGKIAATLGQPTSALTPYLSTLVDLGFVEKRTPITEETPEKSRKGLYFISDNFLRFWFRYVYPYKGELELDNMQIVMDAIAQDFNENYVPFAYEDMCRDLFIAMCRQNELPFTPTRVGAYWSSDYSDDNKIDIVAVDQQNQRLFIGECKYQGQPVDVGAYQLLKEKTAKVTELRKAFADYQVIYGVFSKSGFTQELKDIAAENTNLWLIDEDYAFFEKS